MSIYNEAPEFFGPVTTKWLNLNTTPGVVAHGEGIMYYNSTDKTFNLYNDNTTLDLALGHQTVAKVYNNTGVALPGGKVVSIDGVDGSGFGYAVLTDCTDTALRNATTGLVAADIPNGSYGYVVMHGKLKNVDTSAIAAGSPVWANPAELGGITATEPADNLVSIGTVLTSHATTGSILVNIKIAGSGSNMWYIEESPDMPFPSYNGPRLATNEAVNGIIISANVNEATGYSITNENLGNAAYAGIDMNTDVAGNIGGGMYSFGANYFVPRLQSTTAMWTTTDLELITALQNTEFRVRLGNAATVSFDDADTDEVFKIESDFQTSFPQLTEALIIAKGDQSAVTKKYLDDNFSTIGDLSPFKETTSTGIVSGGALSINADNTKFDVAAGKGYIVDNTVDPPTITEVSFGPFTAQTVTNLATAFATDIAINSSGNIVQQSSFTDAERRSLIMLGGLDHSNQTNILSVFAIQSPMASPASSVQELARAVGDINLSGNVYGPNGVNLNLDKSGGEVFSYGRNNVNDETSPHKIATGVGTLISFGRVFNDGSGNGSFTAVGTTIDPNNYDDGSGTLAAVPVNDWTIQRILFFPNDDKTFVQYGTTTYNRKEDALNAVPRAVFDPLVGIRTAMVRAYLIVKEGETDLSSADTVFLSADRFGIVAGLDGGGASAAWGSIIGTLSDQVDLQAALDSKLDGLTVGNSTFINLSNVGTATVPDITATLSATGTTDSTTFLRGDNTWAVPAYFTPSTLLADYGYTEPTHALADLTDVDSTVSTPSDGDILVYRSAGSDWVLEPKPVPGGGGATQLNELSDVTNVTYTNRHVLIADGTDYDSRALVEADISDFGSYALATHTHTLSDITDITATAAEVNLLDLSGLTAGWVLSADSATTASWKAPTGGIGGSIADNQIAVGAATADSIEGSAALIFDTSVNSVLRVTDGVTTPMLELIGATKSIVLSAFNGLKVDNGTDNSRYDFDRIVFTENSNGGGTGTLIFNTPAASAATWNLPTTSGTIALTSDIIDYSADDTAYGVSWNGNLDAATKNAIYDKIETLGGGATQLSDLSDVNTSTPTNRFVLVADGVDFESRLLVEADISDFGTYSTDIHANITALNAVSGTNTGDQTSIVGITGTKAQFNTALTDGDFLYVGDVTSFPGFTSLLADYGYTEPTHALADLTDVVTATNFSGYVLVANGTTGYVGRQLVEADISDFGTYLTAETSHADVVVDGDFASEGLMRRGATPGTYSIVTDNSANWNTAFGWGDHSLAGYIDGSGVADQIAVFSGAGTLTSSANFSLSPTLFTLDVGGGGNGSISMSLAGVGVIDSATSLEIKTDAFSWKDATGVSTYLDRASGIVRIHGQASLRDYGVGTYTGTEAKLLAVQSNGNIIEKNLADYLTPTGDGSGLTNIDADTLDSLDSTQFLRSDVADIKTAGNLTMNTSVRLQFGTAGAGSEIFYNGTNNYYKLIAGDLIIQDNATSRFTFGRTTGDFINTGVITSQGTGASSFAGKVGIGITSPQTLQHINSASANATVGGTSGAILRLTNTYAGAFNSGGEIQFGLNATAAGRDVLSAIKGTYSSFNSPHYGGNLEFYTRNSDGAGLKERLVITENGNSYFTSGNVGIGLPAPSETLHLSNANSSINSLQSTIAFCGDVSSRYSSISGYRQNSSNENGLLFRTYSAGYLDAMFLSHNRNLGLGTLSPQVAIDVERTKNNAIIRTTSSTDDSLWSDGDIYGSFEMYSQDGSNGGAGLVGYLRAVNSTTATGNRSDLVFGNRDASNLISEKMRLDYLGNLGVGTSTPQRNVDISASNPILRLTSTKDGTWTVGEELAALEFYGSDLSGAGAAVQGKINLVARATFGDDFDMAFHVDDAAGVLTERMRILATGEVGIGTTPTELLHVSGGKYLQRVATNATGSWQLNNAGNTARVRFDLDSDDSSLYLRNSTNTYSIRLDSLGTTYFNGGNVAIGKTTASTALDVTGAGTFSSTVTATNFILSSDKRLKTNIKPISSDDYVDVSWKTFKFKNNKQNRYGVVAQELEKKHPEFVRTDDEGMKSVAYIDLLIAKIAELEARLEKAGM